jgi:hypothetical protein
MLSLPTNVGTGKGGVFEKQNYSTRKAAGGLKCKKFGHRRINLERPRSHMCIHYRTQLLCRVSQTLGKERSANCTSATASLPSTFCRALGKEFAECHLTLGKEKSPSRRQVTVTDPLPSVFFGTRQRGQFCRVSALTALGKDGSSGPHRQSMSLCTSTHGPPSSNIYNRV